MDRLGSAPHLAGQLAVLVNVNFQNFCFKNAFYTFEHMHVLRSARSHYALGRLLVQLPFLDVTYILLCGSETIDFSQS